MIKQEFRENLWLCKIENYKIEKLVLAEKLRFILKNKKIFTHTNLSSLFKDYVDVLIVNALGVTH